MDFTSTVSFTKKKLLPLGEFFSKIVLKDKPCLWVDQAASSRGGSCRPDRSVGVAAVQIVVDRQLVDHGPHPIVDFLLDPLLSRRLVCNRVGGFDKTQDLPSLSGFLSSAAALGHIGGGGFIIAVTAARWIW